MAYVLSSRLRSTGATKITWSRPCTMYLTSGSSSQLHITLRQNGDYFSILHNPTAHVSWVPYTQNRDSRQTTSGRTPGSFPNHTAPEGFHQELEKCEQEVCTLRLIFSTTRPRNMSSSMLFASLKSGSFSNCSPANTMQGCTHTHIWLNHSCAEIIHARPPCSLHHVPCTVVANWHVPVLHPSRYTHDPDDRFLRGESHYC